MFLSNTQLHKHTTIQPGVGDVFSHSVLQFPLIPDSPPFFCFQLQNISNAPHRALRLQSQEDQSTLHTFSAASSTFQLPSLPLTFVVIEIEMKFNKHKV